jgi:hypothetical protein
MRILCTAVWLAGCFTMSAAELSIPRTSLTPGGVAAAELRYASQGGHVAAFQVDVQYDAANLKVVCVAGPATTAKGKLVGSTEIAPGRMRIALYGFNQSVLEDGIVVSLLISSNSGVPGSYALALTNPIAADSDGRQVGLATINGAVSIVRSTGQTPNAATLGQVVSGGSWKTTLTLVNNSPARADVRLSFWGDDGQPLVLPLTFPGGAGSSPSSTSSLECSIDPEAMLVVETEAPDALESLAGWAELQSPEGVIGFAVLRQKVGPGRDTEAMLVFEPPKGPVLVLPYDNSGGFQTGIAIANPSPTLTADLTLVVRDEAGSTISQESLPLPARGHVSFAASDRFSVLSGRRGTLEVQSGSGEAITMLGLRFNPFGSFTSVPVIAKN